MQKAIIFILLVGKFLFTAAQTLQPINEKASITFTIKNFGINTGGSFKKLQGKIFFDTANLAKSFFDINIDASSINTDNTARDNHLRKKEYFDVAIHPHIFFISDKIIKLKTGGFQVYGKLTIKGIVKELNFPFKVGIKNETYAFQGSFQLNRRDFKVGGNSMVLGDNVNVQLLVNAKK